MIYLIGGPPKCGKTTLAKKLSSKYGVPWISADTLQNIIWAYTPKNGRSKLFPHTYLRDSSNDKFYSEHSAQQIVKNYIAQAKTSYEAIAMMAETYLTDEDNFIIEGYQVTPKIVNRIIKRFGPNHVKAAFLLKFNEEKFVKDIHKSTTPNDWILRKTKDKATFGRIAKMVTEYSRYFEKEAKKYHLPVFNMDEDFEKKLTLAERPLLVGIKQAKRRWMRP